MTLDVLCLGEALLDLYAPRGVSFADARALRVRPGGAAVNVALALARRGLAVGLAATLGQDALGRALGAKIAAAGVDTSLVAYGAARTGLVFVEATQAGRRFVGYRPAAEVAPPLPAWEARALVVTGLAQDEAQAAAFGEAAAQARRQGAVVVVDLNARPLLWARGGEGARHGVIDAADLVKASADDLATMGLTAEDLRARMRPEAAMVITRGAAPALAAGRFGEIEVAPDPLDVVDPTGAGDAFTARLVREFLRGAPGDAASWRRALRRGHGAARRHVTRWSTK